MPTETKKQSQPKVLQIPAACPKCHSTKFMKNVPGCKVLCRDIAGTIEGFHYQRVKWTRKRCECGQLLMVRTYLRSANGKP